MAPDLVAYRVETETMAYAIAEEKIIIPAFMGKVRTISEKVKMTGLTS
jgi:hypothetical protein